MANRKGRPPLADRPVRWTIWLPSSVANEIQLLLADPARLRIPDGARSDLITQLLREWLRSRKTQQSSQPSQSMEQ